MAKGTIVLEKAIFILFIKTKLFNKYFTEEEGDDMEEKKKKVNAVVFFFPPLIIRINT